MLSVTTVLGAEQCLAVHRGTSEPASPADISPVSHLTAGTVEKFVFLPVWPQPVPLSQGKLCETHMGLLWRRGFQWEKIMPGPLVSIYANTLQLRV